MIIAYICDIINISLKINNNGGKTMQNYKKPTVEVEEVETKDVLTTSPGTETPWYEENDGVWEIGINP